MASPFSWPVLVPSALRAPAPVNFGVRHRMPSAPTYFYRYRSLSGEQSKWVEQSVLFDKHFFASPNSFNDPFDCKPYFSITAQRQPLIKYYEGVIQRVNPSMGREERRAEARRRVSNSESDPRNPENMTGFLHLYHEAVTNRVGILCVSEVCDEILMWAHYADAHRGVCLQFNAQDPFLSNAQPISYQSERPKVNPVVQTHDEMLDKAMLTKSSHWAYEREWRLMQYKNGSGAYTLPSPALTGIILGAQISKEDRARVIGWAKAVTKPIRLYQAELSTTQFAIHINAIDA